ncbi:MAG: isoprenylcysteine carboxylmethyltransferase family protein [Anaerolineae bacterium]|nr:isoprenylcysteine carboxylmethyltransferase family protein [Anaerolineae bacterium]
MHFECKLDLHPAARTGFFILGLGIIGAAVWVMGVSVRQRKTLGGENVKVGLLTSGVYRYFRHPIYVGIIGVSLGIALLASSWDGLLKFPAVAAINVAQAVIEERYDIGKRFAAQYQEYRKRTRLLGSLWMWATLLGCMGVVAVVIPWMGG